MSEFKGTPGKFTHDVIESCSGEVFVSVLDADGVSIAFCGKDKIAEANAQLFSAAPDLLEELQKLRAYVIDVCAVDEEDCHAEHPLMSSKSAITKALGETK